MSLVSCFRRGRSTSQAVENRKYTVINLEREMD